METFLTIGSEKELLRLGRLPLTGRFLNQCIDSFTYLENVKYMSQFQVDFWGIGDDGKLVCQCIVAPGTERILIAGSPSQEHSVYLIEMQLEDGQIDDMEITLMGAYGREGWTHSREHSFNRISSDNGIFKKDGKSANIKIFSCIKEGIRYYARYK